MVKLLFSTELPKREEIGWFGRLIIGFYGKITKIG
jgi:hypothetical protein